MKRLVYSTLLTSLLALFAPAPAQTRTYDVVTADVPFKFKVGKRTFRPGHYQFVLAGTGLLAVRDGRQRVIASLITRTSEASAPSPTTRLSFDHSRKPVRLEKIFLEKRVQVLEVIGEELAVRSSPPRELTLPLDLPSYGGRRDGFRLKQ